MKELMAVLGFAAFGFLLILFISFLGAVVTKIAWAYSVAEIFHLSELTFLQAFALNVLGGMVCKGSNASASKK